MTPVHQEMPASNLVTTGGAVSNLVSPDDWQVPPSAHSMDAGLHPHHEEEEVIFITMTTGETLESLMLQTFRRHIDTKACALDSSSPSQAKSKTSTQIVKIQTLTTITTKLNATWHPCILRDDHFGEGAGSSPDWLSLRAVAARDWLAKDASLLSIRGFQVTPGVGAGSGASSLHFSVKHCVCVC
eukprot:superscaffoldBa00001845_g12241